MTIQSLEDLNLQAVPMSRLAKIGIPTSAERNVGTNPLTS